MSKAAWIVNNMERNSSEHKMSPLFDDLQEGLIQAIDNANGEGSARVYTNNVDLMIDIAKDQQSEITNQPETV